MGSRSRSGRLESQGASAAVGRDALLHVGRPVLPGLHWLHGVVGYADDRHHERCRKVSRTFLVRLCASGETDPQWFRRYEFATLGMIWIYALVSLVCLSALTLRTAVSLRRTKRGRLDALPPVAASRKPRRHRPTEQVRPCDWAEGQLEYGVGGEGDWRTGEDSWDEKRGGERPPNE